MNICIPKERRTFEFRVGLTPTGVKMLSEMGNICYVEHEAGLRAGFSDLEYQQAGARIAYTAHEVFARADLLLKVARPLREEIEWLCPGAILAGLLHLTSSRKDKLRLFHEKAVTTLAYEQIRMPDGSGPVRTPLSEIGGRLAAQIGARLMQNDFDGKGILLGGVPGVPPAEVVILGAGVVGASATRAFLGMGAHVIVLDSDLEALQRICTVYPTITTLISNPVNIAYACTFADILVGAVFVPGERSPIVVTREMVRTMKPRSLVMDISIDEGGCIETSRPTTHEIPTFVEEGVLHYCVPNIPSIVARTATYAFMNAAFPFIEQIVREGIDETIDKNPAAAHGVQIYRGEPRYMWSLNLEAV
jgi:alanine dehydrogenase